MTDTLKAALANPQALHAAAPLISDVLEKVSEIQAMQLAASRREAVQSLCGSGLTMPPDNRPIPFEAIEALLSVPQQQFEALRSFTKHIVDNTSTGTPEDEIGDLASLIHACYVAMPMASRKIIIGVLPNKEAKAAAVALSFMKSDALGKMVKSIPELQKAVVNVMNTENNTPEFRVKRVEGMLLLRNTYVAIPERSRRTIMPLVPEAGRPVLETAEGLSSKRDMEKILKMIDEKDGKLSGAAGGAGGAGGQAASFGEQKEGKNESESMVAAKKAASVGGLAARAESRRLWAWIRGDPCSLRVFNFLIGVFLIVSGFIGVFIEVFNRFRFFQIGIMFYVSMFGWVFAALEVKSAICSTRVVGMIEKYIGCLTTATGRSLFLAFSGLCCFAAFDPKTDGWTEIVAFACGGCCFVLSIVNLVIGCCAAKQLRQAKSNIASLDELRRKFDEYDMEMNGSLQPEDVVDLLASLEPPTLLSKNEMHIALLQLDQDNDGSISFPELSNWFSGGSASAHSNLVGSESTTNPLQSADNETGLTTALAPSDAVDPDSKQRYSMNTNGAGWLRCTTLIVVVVFTLVSFSMIFVELFWASQQKNASKGVWFFQALLQVVLTLMGILCVVLEGRFTMGGTNCTLALSKHARLLNRVWGRGIFYLFLATMCCGVGTMQERVEDTATIIAGVLLLVWSVVNIVIGCWAQSAMAGMGEITVTQAQEEFRLADADGNGYLDSTELVAVMEKLNVTLGRTQLESAYIQIDTDGDGKITEREFVSWTQGGEVSDLVEQRVGAP